MLRKNRNPPDFSVTIAVFAALLAWCALAGAQQTIPELTHRLTRLANPVMAPDFTAPDMDGEQHSLSDYRGKVVLINFWATWCPPCRREMPSMERLYRKLGAESFAVLAVNQWETEEHVFAYLGQLGVDPSFPILFDHDSKVSAAYGVVGLPSSVIVDREGRIVYRAVGGREFDHPDIEKAVRELLD